MLYPISVTIDGYIQADNYEEAQALAKRLELRELELQDKDDPEEFFGIQLEQPEISGITVLFRE